MKTEVITVGPNHPAWKSLDDDDWNGHTFSNWLTGLKECIVILQPGPDLDPDILKRMQEIVGRCAKECRTEP
jgi:hypothetical protein